MHVAWLPFWHVAGTIPAQINGQDVCAKAEVLDLLFELLQLYQVSMM